MIELVTSRRLLVRCGVTEPSVCQKKSSSTVPPVVLSKVMVSIQRAWLNAVL
jgi:hypothetical protein